MNHHSGMTFMLAKIIPVVIKSPIVVDAVLMETQVVKTMFLHN